MPGEVHPGSFVGDSVEEFKKLPTWGKVAVAAGFVLVAYLAIRARQQAALTPSTSTGASAGVQSPFPMVGNVPLVPSDVHPVYDPNGNLVDFQQNAPAAPPPTVTPPVPTPKPPPKPGTPPPHHGPPPKPPRRPAPPPKRIVPPPGHPGVIGRNAAGNPVAYSGTANHMSNPNVYHQAAAPHISSAHNWGAQGFGTAGIPPIVTTTPSGHTYQNNASQTPQMRGPS